MKRKNKKRQYTTVSISRETRMYLDEVKRHLTIENNGRFIDLNGCIEWMLKQTGYIIP